MKTRNYLEAIVSVLIVYLATSYVMYDLFWVVNLNDILDRLKAALLFPVASFFIYILFQIIKYAP